MVFDPAPAFLDFIKFMTFMSIVMLSLVVLVPAVYVIFRAASLGWYKSRYEHFKKLWPHNNGDRE